MCVFVFVSSYLVETVTNKPVITRQPSWSQIFQGEKITLTCEVQGGEKTDWRYYWRRNSQSLPEDEKLLQCTASESLNGEYECMATRRDDFYSSTTWSEAFTVSASLTNKPVITRQPSWSQIFQGEKITLTCEVQGGEKTDWRYYWLKDSHQLPGENEKLVQLTASESFNGKYYCMATSRDDSYPSTTWSEAFTVSKPRVTLPPGTTTISVGGSVSLSCSVRDSDGWKYEVKTVQSREPFHVEFACCPCACGFCWRTPALPVSFVFYLFPGAVLKIDPGWSTLFIGEFVTLTCDIEGAEAGWEYSFYKDQQEYSPGYQTTNYYRFQITSSNDGGEYGCVGRHKWSFETEKSETVSFTAAGTARPAAGSPHAVPPRADSRDAGSGRPLADSPSAGPPGAMGDFTSWLDIGDQQPRWSDRPFGFLSFK
uniref:Ig-like domain-containing protein n=1 Tax=Salarias fasciatus TaxID=181472 RepID=A0A672II74_SALFA